MNLAETQALFWELLQGRESARLAECFAGDAALPAPERVAIYQRMVAHRQVDALREDFPKLAALLGDDAFFALAERYVRAHPSEHPDLGQLGRALPDFAARTLPAAAAELAQLERLRSQVFDAADAVPAGPEALAALPAEAFAGARLQLVPALRLFAAGHDVCALWQALEDEQEQVAQPAPLPTQVAVWRRGYEVHHAALGPSEARALELAVQGAPLGELCAAFAGEADPAAAAFTALGSWFAEGWVEIVRSDAARDN